MHRFLILQGPDFEIEGDYFDHTAIVPASTVRELAGKHGFLNDSRSHGGTVLKVYEFNSLEEVYEAVPEQELRKLLREGEIEP